MSPAPKPAAAQPEADLRRLYAAALAHLMATGTCAAALAGDRMCDREACTYCALALAVERVGELPA